MVICEIVHCYICHILKNIKIILIILFLYVRLTCYTCKFLWGTVQYFNAFTEHTINKLGNWLISLSLCWCLTVPLFHFCMKHISFWNMVQPWLFGMLEPVTFDCGLAPIMRLSANNYCNRFRSTFFFFFTSICDREHAVLFFPYLFL